MTDDTSRLAQQFVRTFTGRIRSETEYRIPKTHLGYVRNRKGPTVEVAGQVLQRSSYRIAKHVSIKNLRKNDEVLMVETVAGTYVLVAVIRTESDNSDSFGASAGTKFKQNVGNGADTSFTITHGLGTKDVSVTVHNRTTGAIVEPTSVTLTTNNALIIVFPSAPASKNYRVVVMS